MLNPARNLVLAVCFSALALPALAQDVEGSADHPLVGRYEGSTIEEYTDIAYDEVYLLKAPNDWTSKVPNSTTDHSGSEWLGLEGRIIRIRYIAPQGRSSLEIYRNYQEALKAKGFETIFECTDAKCFVGDHDALPSQLGMLFEQTPGNENSYWDHGRYLLVHLAAPEGAVYAMVLVGENQGQAVARVIVVETKEMETNKIVVKSAEEMGEGLGVMGDSVNIYSLSFDFDKAELKAESAPTLDEIAKLLNNMPDLKLSIVGHTDNQGSAEYNLDLSRKRAEAVVKALVETRGIAAGRLTSSGEGMNKPIASNDTETGRAENRRVELVRTSS